MDQISKKKNNAPKNQQRNGLYLFKIQPEYRQNKKSSSKFPNMNLAYQLKNEFFALWNQTSHQAAEDFLESWYQKVSKTKLPTLKGAAELLKTHKQYIVQFLELPTNLTAIEKIQENKQAATRRTKGLKNFENVSHMIYCYCGKLTFPSN